MEAYPFCAAERIETAGPTQLDRPRREVLAWVDLVDIVRETRREEAAKVRAECAAELDEAKALLAAMAGELALLRQRGP